jgi:dihydrofolate synthase/folylpolyglutamate synthase
MSETPTSPPAQVSAPPPIHSYADAERALLARWPETRLEPSLDRIAAFVELLGEPQRAYPVVHLTGTNGKTSTSRMVDTLVRALDLRTGRFTSPHVESMTERISLDGERLTEEQFLAAYNDVAGIAALADEEGSQPLSFFEMMVGMAYAAFANAPVDVAVVEVGMGGSWDATNVADASVAVILPVAVDHSAYLGARPVDIAREKVGIIKPGSRVVCAAQAEDVEAVVAERATEVGATVLWEGRDFGVSQRVPAVGGQMLRLQGLRAEYDEVFLPLYGAHQGQNAAVALAAVEAFVGADPLDAELVRAAFEEVTSPGRLEIIRRSPAIVLDAAHNPHGAAAVVHALEDSFTFDPLVGVVAVMTDKDYEGLLAAFEPVMAAIVCTQNGTPRALPADRLAEVARGIFGIDRVYLAPRLDDAIEQAATLAEEGGLFGEAIGSGGVLITGSVVTVGEARTMLKRRERA